MQILITGGTGFIGSPLCSLLLACGHRLTLLSRRPHNATTALANSVTFIRHLDEWLPPVSFDAVINFAGEPIADVAWTKTRKEQLWESRVTLTTSLVTRLIESAHPPAVLISGSAIGYYGNHPSNLLDESTPPGTDFSAQLCISWEAAAQKASQVGTRVCLVRTGLVLHPNGGLLGKMLPAFKLGLGTRLGTGKQWMSWIHLSDYMAIVLALLENPSAHGAFNLTAPEPVTNDVFSKTLAHALHRPLLLSAPANLLKLVLGERAQLLVDGQCVLPTKVKALGYTFCYPNLQDALQHLLTQ